MNIRKLTSSSLLLAIGLILHQITPPILFGMKPDFLLSLMLIAIVIADDYKVTIVISIVSGILTAATTSFPGGQIPNIIDKLITAQCVYFMNRALGNYINDQIKMSIISIIGTLISGIVFLSSAFFIFGLPGSFKTLVLLVVLPASLINCAAVFVLYNIVKSALRIAKN